jgi:hypothetical protein
MDRWRAHEPLRRILANDGQAEVADREAWQARRMGMVGIKTQSLARRDSLDNEGVRADAVVSGSRFPATRRWPGRTPPHHAPQGRARGRDRSVHDDARIPEPGLQASCLAAGTFWLPCPALHWTMARRRRDGRELARDRCTPPRAITVTSPGSITTRLDLLCAAEPAAADAAEALW